MNLATNFLETARRIRPSGSHCRLSACEVDHEWDAGVEPMAVKVLDLGSGGAPAQMKPALSPVSAAGVYRRWVDVLGFLDRYPSTRLLAQRLDRDGADRSVFAEAVRRDERPVFTPIDSWGHTPFDSVALSAQSVTGWSDPT